MNADQMTERRALDTLTQEPQAFRIKSPDGEEDITLHLYPLQLGRLMMISRRLLLLDIALSDDAENEVKKMWKICANKAEEVAEVIAIATLQTHAEVVEQLEERTRLILHSPTMTPAALSVLFSGIVFQSYYADFTNAIRSVKMLQAEVSPTTKASRIATTEDRPSGGASTQ